MLNAEAYTAASGASDDGDPVFHHIERLVEGGIIWAPAIEGGFVVTIRGGDFELDIGQDISIGDLSHSNTVVELYFQETFTFRLLTTETAVALENNQLGRCVTRRACSSDPGSGRRGCTARRRPR